jgi:hypothetical protein
MPSHADEGDCRALRGRTAEGGCPDMRMFCIAANVTMVALAVALVLSIGRARTLANPQILLVAGLLLVEILFSLGKNA